MQRSVGFSNPDTAFPTKEMLVWVAKIPGKSHLKTMEIRSEISRGNAPKNDQKQCEFTMENTKS